MPPPPPPASDFVSRLFIGPALRMQPDRRLVSLVRAGYETAFDEIVRRYGRALGRYAAAIVPSHRAEDVTQDAFSKALLALRDTDREIDLRPWLYRIVRNTALNDLRDEPPPTQELDERADGVEQPPELVERREEIAELLRRLGELPEPQRAAIVMRELEGLSHEEIAGALGMTGGAARQTIYRARRALRDAVGLLIPVPALQWLLASSAGLGGIAAGGAATGAGASLGGAGIGVGAKAGLATLVLAGSVAAGVAIKDRSLQGRDGPTQAVAKQSGTPNKRSAATGSSANAPLVTEDSGSGGEGHSSNRGPGGGGGGHDGDDEGHGDGGGSGDSGKGGGEKVESGGGSRSGPGGGGGSGSDDGSDNSGPGTLGSGSSGSGSSGSGSSGSGSSGSGSSSSGSSGSGSSGPGPGAVLEPSADDDPLEVDD